MTGWAFWGYYLACFGMFLAFFFFLVFFCFVLGISGFKAFWGIFGFVWQFNDERGGDLGWFWDCIGSLIVIMILTRGHFGYIFIILVVLGRQYLETRKTEFYIMYPGIIIVIILFHQLSILLSPPFYLTLLHPSPLQTKTSSATIRSMLRSEKTRPFRHLSNSTSLRPTFDSVFIR